MANSFFSSTSNLFKMRLKSIILLLSAMWLGFSASAQERSFGTLPLIQKPGATRPGVTKIEDTPEYKRALAVYERLVQARGDFRYPVPTFVLSAAEEQVAYVRYDQLEIGLEKKAYDVCASYGEDAEAAIAFLLGHELTHYYEKHAWRRGFVADHKDLKIGIKLDSIADGVANETEADYLGGFLAYSAGFGLFDKGDDVIAKLYKAYGLDRLTPKEQAEMDKIYPSLADRQTLSKRSAEKLSRLVEVFDMANLLTAIGKYAEAVDYYQYILMEYQSRETYNNLGVTIVLDALKLFNENELKFRYPLELDLESSATKGDGMVSARTRLLQQAVLHFDAAISLDPNYAPAYLNKACAFALMGDYTRARFYAGIEAREAVQKGNYPKTGTDIDILLGIIDFYEGQEQKATAAFQKAVTADSSPIAAYNLKKLRNDEIATERTALGGRLERIDGKTFMEMDNFDLDELPTDPRHTVAVGGKVNFYQNPLYGDNSRLFINHTRRPSHKTVLHMTGPGYTGKTSERIGLGATRQEIVEKYGEPKRTVETPRGQIMVYESRRIIFILGAGGKLERWVIFTDFKSDF
jgi:tetratricopeptide (TPR) repeat protein